MNPLRALMQRLATAVASFIRPSPLPEDHRRGRWGEDYVARRLRREGLRVLQRNWRDGRREIDLIMIDRASGEIVFVEVKTRTERPGAPLFDDIVLLTDEQHARITAAIATFLRGHSLILKRKGIRRYRLELIKVLLRSAPMRTGGTGWAVTERSKSTAGITERTVLARGAIEELIAG